MLKDDLDPRNPVGFLAVDEVADDVERAPGIGPLVRPHPRLRQPGEHLAQCLWRSGQDLQGLIELNLHTLLLPNSRES